MAGVIRELPKKTGLASDDETGRRMSTRAGPPKWDVAPRWHGQASPLALHQRMSTVSGGDFAFSQVFLVRPGELNGSMGRQKNGLGGGQTHLFGGGLQEVG